MYRKFLEVWRYVSGQTDAQTYCILHILPNGEVVTYKLPLNDHFSVEPGLASQFSSCTCSKGEPLGINSTSFLRLDVVPVTQLC